VICFFIKEKFQVKQYIADGKVFAGKKKTIKEAFPVLPQKPFHFIFLWALLLCDIPVSVVDFQVIK